VVILHVHKHEKKKQLENLSREDYMRGM